MVKVLCASIVLLATCAIAVRAQTTSGFSAAGGALDSGPQTPWVRGVVGATQQSLIPRPLLASPSRPAVQAAAIECRSDWDCGGIPDGFCDAYYACETAKYACVPNARTGLKECKYVGDCPRCQPAPSQCTAVAPARP